MLMQKALHTIVRHDKYNEAKFVDLKVRSGNKINTINLNSNSYQSNHDHL